MRTAEWAGMPLALRDRALFSAGVSNAKLLAQMQNKIQKALSMDGHGFMSRDRFVSEMKRWLENNGYAVDGTSLRDITSNKRLSLIYEFNVEQARQFSAWEQGMDADILNAFPAQELFRMERREVPRDWALRWKSAGGKFYGGRMIALKTDPVWMKISRFGTPYPPFDFNSGMNVRDIRRKEAVNMGLIAAHEDVLPDAAMGKYLAETDISNIPETLRAPMLDMFEKSVLHVELSGNTLRLLDRAVSRPTWSDYGFSDAASWSNAKISETLMDASEARAALRHGEEVKTPVGEIVYDENVLRHWEFTGKDEANIRGRLERYGVAKKAAKNAREVWDDGGQLSILNIYEKPSGKIKGVATVTDKVTHKSVTYFLTNPKELNRLRHGKRIYSR